jgi:hypothetical protein
MVDPLASEYPHNSVYALQENKFGMGVELEGAELKEFGNWISKKVDQVLSYTDVDDITVTVTNFTRSGNAVHIDGQPATGSDKVFAAGGLLLPAVSGAAVKKVAGKIIDAVVKTEKSTEKAKDGARFIADTDGKIIDTKTTPKGSYTHADGSRTDVLQDKSHFNKAKQENHGTSHTHEPFKNTDPKTGNTYSGADNKSTHRPTYQEVKDIETGKSKRN